MRLLITTQAVDLDDPVLAFFHRWIEEFAKNAEHVHVICLKEGRHTLPKNVSVHSLGKEKGRSVLRYVTRFYRYAWRLRHDYDVVFVHMNPEYLVLGGRLWRWLRKRVGIWYIHPRSSFRLRYGMNFAHKIFSASGKSFPHESPKLIPVGLGVDTDFFKPADRASSAELRVMSAARIAPVKRVECIVEAAEELVKRHTPFLYDYYGEELPRDAEYARELRKRAEQINAWTWKGKASPEEVIRAYQSHDVHVNATDSGSFDKAVIEAMACGCISVASNSALIDVLPRELMFEEGSARSLAQTLEHIAHLPREDREAMRQQMRRMALERYSLSALIVRILDNLKYGIA